MTSVGPWGRRAWSAVARGVSRSRSRSEEGPAGAAVFRHRKRRAGAQEARPAVLFCDPAGYEQLDQLAATLRRWGIAAVRVEPLPSEAGGARSPARRLRDRLFYDRAIALKTPDDVAALEARGLGDLRILDAVVAESLVAERGLDDPVLAALGDHSLAFARHGPRRLLDKFEVNALLEAAGVRIPAQCSAAELSPAQAVRALGLPLVVKGKVGLGGDGVRIARSLAEVEKALEDLCGENLGYGFFQAHVEGQAVGYICVGGPAGAVLEKGYRVDAAQWALGPSANVATDDDPAIVAVGRSVVEALGCQAFAQIDMIRDAAGQVWPIDANLRPSGNTLAFLHLGLDFPAAYASLLLGPAMPRARPLGPPRADAADVMPVGLYDAARNGSARRLATAMDRCMWMCRKGPGWRYGLVVTAKMLIVLARRLTRRRG